MGILDEVRDYSSASLVFVFIPVSLMPFDSTTILSGSGWNRSKCVIARRWKITLYRNFFVRLSGWSERSSGL